MYCAGPYEYRVGTPEEVEESIVRQIQLFHLSECRDKIEQSELYKRVKARPYRGCNRHFTALTTIGMWSSTLQKLN